MYVADVIGVSEKKVLRDEAACEVNRLYASHLSR
jgi:hypothetical protein